MKPDTTNPLQPTPSLLCKLGSIIVHLEEGTSKDGHAYDMIAMKQAANDPEVKGWLAAMDAMAMLPVKRNK